MILTNIERTVKGLGIFSNYLPNAHIFGARNINWFLELQDEALIDITDEDKLILFQYGWRLYGNNYHWIILTDKGFDNEATDHYCIWHKCVDDYVSSE